MQKTDLISPITSLHFVKDLILSGEGPHLCIYNTLNGKKILSEHVLRNSRIHGIKAKGKEVLLLAVFGQRFMRILEITNQTRIESKTSVVSFPDLILDVHWLCGHDGKSNAVAIATAHNAVWCFDWETDQNWQVAQCEEDSILYSARFFGNNLDNLLLASGTVFSQALLWKVKGTKTKENKIKILNRLSGHEGVIFKINFNNSGTLMTSVSDDRSIRLWKLTHSAADFTGEVEHLLVLYGHSARVWDAKMLQDCIVSIGEDAVCNVWGYDGKLVKTFSGHKGRSIWSLAINKDERTIATGGGDGSIRLFSLDDLNTRETMVTVEAFLPGTEEHLKANKKGRATVDSPRSVSLVNDGRFLVMTSEGCLYEYTWSEKMERMALKTLGENVIMEHQDESLEEKNPSEWNLLLHDSNYSSYSLMTVSSDRELVAFGNLEGSIKVHQTNFSSAAVEVKPFKSKVLSLLWLDHKGSYSLFSCGPEGKIIWWRVFRDGKQVLRMDQIRTLCIPYSKQRWASAVEVLDQGVMSPEGEEEVGSCHVVFGDRKGSVHLFDARGSTVEKVLEPVHSLPVLHGRIGVTQLCTHDNKLYSAGRDGTYRQYRLVQSTLEVIDTKKVFKGLEWVEKLIFTPNGDLVVAGFHTAYFIVWSVGKNEPLFKVKCGGGHRAWDFSLNHSQESGCFEAVFTYLKGNCVNVHKEELKNSISKPVLKDGFHGRETTCMCYVSDMSPDNQGYHLFVTGSEDTTINLVLYDSTLGCLTKVFTAQGHISSVRALSITKCIAAIHKTNSVRMLNSIQKGIHNSTGASNTLKSSVTATESPTREDNTEDRGSKMYLLFSGGGRASLRCWRVDPSAVSTNNNGVVTSSPVYLLCEYSSRSSNKRRRRKRYGGQIHSEIRFMSLTSFSISAVMGEEKLRDESRYLYGVVSACSDGFVRVFIFDEKESKFSLLAQSEYLQRCVLTVDHLVHRTPSGQCSVLVFAGDTAGKISVWDITRHLIEYVSEEDDENDDVAMETDRSDAAMETDRSFVDMEREKSLNFLDLEDSIIFSKRDTEYSKDGLMENSITQLMKRTNNRQSLPGTSSSSSTTKENETLVDSIEVMKDKNKFSCINLVENSLGQPLHVFRAHQSGVNDISICKGCSSYVLCSGGDDSALFIAVFSIDYSDQESRGIHVIREESVQSAHTSSVTGIRLLDPSRMISSSTDQRLKLWNISSHKDIASDDKLVALGQVEFIDVPDVQAIETWKTWKDGRTRTVGVCGVGLQMVLIE